MDCKLSKISFIIINSACNYKFLSWVEGLPTFFCGRMTFPISTCQKRCFENMFLQSQVFQDFRALLENFPRRATESWTKGLLQAPLERALEI